MGDGMTCDGVNFRKITTSTSTATTTTTISGATVYTKQSSVLVKWSKCQQTGEIKCSSKDYNLCHQEAQAACQNTQGCIAFAVRKRSGYSYVKYTDTPSCLQVNSHSANFWDLYTATTTTTTSTP